MIDQAANERALGCFWGLAIGDAMGMPTSFLTPSEIRRHFGAIEDFKPPLPGHRYHDGLTAGQVTDDTEQALALARSFIRCGRVEPRDIVTELLAWARRVQGKYVSPLGPSTRRALERIAEGAPLVEAGREGDTNGAAMRVAPLGILHGLRGSSLEELLGDVVLTCLPTHGTDVAIASAAAVAWAIAFCFQNSSHLRASWGDASLVLAVLDAARLAAERAQSQGFPIVAPSIPKRIEWVAQLSLNGHAPSQILREVYDLIGTGVAAADSVPAAFGVFAAARGDPQQAILLAANMGGDCDTIGALAGALAGAFQGVIALPAPWVETVQRMNQLDLESVVEALVATSFHWQPAAWNSIIPYNQVV